MNVFSRIGLVSLVAFTGTSAVFAGAPANTSSVTAAITSISTGETFSLRSTMGRYLAIHFIPVSEQPDDSSADADFVKSHVRGAATLAGVRELFVLEAGTDQAKAWTKQFGDGAAELFVDSSGALAVELALTPASPLSMPATIVFDPSGAELFRHIGHDRHDHLTFGAFEQRLTKATQTSALSDYNLPKDQRVAVDGYDVVSYFAENKAVKGKPTLISSFRGVKYQFANEANRAAFAKDPEKYLPTYGGWCASAMGAKGTKVEIDPTNFKVSGGRLFLFYKDFFSDALKDWNKHEAEWEPAADTKWKKLSGEPPSQPSK